MSKPKILLQLDTDPQPSVFDAVVAIDSGAEHLLRHGGVSADNVRELVYGGMFTRGPADLHSTAVFIGGTNVAAAEAILARVRKTFFGPLRMSVLMDAGGCNTTAAAAVVSASRHLNLAKTTALVLGGTGPVGQRVAQLLARTGTTVRVGSRQRDRAEALAQRIAALVDNGKLSAWATHTEESLQAALQGVELVIAAGAAGVTLLPAATRKHAAGLRVAIDLNAVPPVGIEGVEPAAKAAELDGAVVYGALAVGGLKMKIHRAAIERLFTANDRILDAEEVYEIARNQEAARS
jgi:threonine dehydrogenase-like Zn-dependent dehydrogenase